MNTLKTSFIGLSAFALAASTEPQSVDTQAMADCFAGLTEDQRTEGQVEPEVAVIDLQAADTSYRITMTIDMGIDNPTRFVEIKSFQGSQIKSYDFWGGNGHELNPDSPEEHYLSETTVAQKLPNQVVEEIRKVCSEV